MRILRIVTHAWFAVCLLKFSAVDQEGSSGISVSGARGFGQWCWGFRPVSFPCGLFVNNIKTFSACGARVSASGAREI